MSKFGAFIFTIGLLFCFSHTASADSYTETFDFTSHTGFANGWYLTDQNGQYQALIDFNFLNPNNQAIYQKWNVVGQICTKYRADGSCKRYENTYGWVTLDEIEAPSPDVALGSIPSDLEMTSALLSFTLWDNDNDREIIEVVGLGADDGFSYIQTLDFRSTAAHPVLLIADLNVMTQFGDFVLNLRATDCDYDLWLKSMTLSVEGIEQQELLPPQVPEPASLMLLGSGLLGLCFWARRKMNR